MHAVKTIRARLGVTQRALADALGCTQGNIGFYERGQTIPPPVARRLIEYAARCGLALTFDHVYGAVQLPAEYQPPGAAGQGGAQAAEASSAGAPPAPALAGRLVRQGQKQHFTKEPTCL